jgi:hypothetical protein
MVIYLGFATIYYGGKDKGKINKKNLDFKWN